MHMSCAVNQHVTTRQQAADSARRTRLFPTSYQNNKHIIRLARSKRHIQILALSRLLCHNQTRWESLTHTYATHITLRSINHNRCPFFYPYYVRRSAKVSSNYRGTAISNSLPFARDDYHFHEVQRSRITRRRQDSRELGARSFNKNPGYGKNGFATRELH